MQYDIAPVDWLERMIHPYREVFIPLSNYDGQTRAALLVKFNSYENHHVYEIIGFEYLEDPSTYQVISDHLHVKKDNPHTFELKGHLEGHPFELHLYHDWNNEAHITARWVHHHHHGRRELELHVPKHSIYALVSQASQY